MSVAETGSKQTVTGKNCEENQNTHLMLNNFLPPIHSLLRNKVEKYSTAAQDTYDKIMRRRKYVGLHAG